MKNSTEKAIVAFEELAKQLNATVSISEIGPNIKGCDIDFEFGESSSSDLVERNYTNVYLWDRKHGMSKIREQEPIIGEFTELYGNLGYAILMGSAKGENTRFSYIAIHQRSENILKVYPSTMKEVKMWIAYREMEWYIEQDDYHLAKEFSK